MENTDIRGIICNNGTRVDFAVAIFRDSGGNETLESFHINDIPINCGTIRLNSASDLSTYMESRGFLCTSYDRSQKTVLRQTWLRI